MNNYGLDFARELQEQSDKDWILAGDEVVPCLTQGMVNTSRIRFLPQGEIQRSKVEDMMDCASRSAVNLLETKFNWLIAHKKISKTNLYWLYANGYIDNNNTVKFSDAFVAINSGTTRRGNSLKAPLEAIRTQGLIPKHRLPLSENMTWEQYHDPDRITYQDKGLGLEFAKRFTINYERVYRADFRFLLESDMVNGAGYAWPAPDKKGVYQKTNRQPNHAFVFYLNDNKDRLFSIFDNYIDSFDQDFMKTLAHDYDILDYGYRVYISKEIIPIKGEPVGFMEMVHKIINWFKLSLARI